MLSSSRLNITDLAWYLPGPRLMRGTWLFWCSIPRDNDADFSAPYMESDFTLLVPVGSAIHKFADADQSGKRIGVPRGDAVDLNLTRLAKNALLVRVDNQTA